MTYDQLKKQGTKVYEQDHYDGGIYLYTEEYWARNGVLYMHDEHPNANRYTGRTRTYRPADFLAKYIIEDYIPNDLGEAEVAERLKKLTNY